jgi:signal transduction histidine kinase/AraC-like DNA-binding protein
MQAKILAIDDEPQFEILLRQRFRKQIREGLFNFVFAENGLHALEVIEEQPDIDMVLTDINMPRMDGLTLLERLKTVRPLMKTVIVSAYGDMGNIRRAMNLGAFDFVTKPIEFVDLQTTIEKTLRETDLIRQAVQAKDLAEQNEKLKELDELKSQFFTNISHEFRTPLTVISGMAEQIEKTPERWLGRGLVMIRRNTQNLLDLVNQILELRRLESGKLQLKLVRSNVIHFLQYLAESFQSLAEIRDIQLHFQSNVPDLTMTFDPEKLQRILFNLLSNAIKFTPTGGQVYLIVAKRDGAMQMVVKDTGIGLSEDHIDKVFDRYFSLDNPDSPNPFGTGIGLSLVKELVKLMGGEIGVSSRQGEGTSFTMTLPLDVAGEAAVPEPLVESGTLSVGLSQVEPSLEELEEAKQHDDPSGLPQLLIVEDNPDVAQYLVACLEGLFDLRLARDGQKGMDIALEEVPDIIISDVMMPLKNGYELCETLKTDERTSHIPIILLTAKGDQESLVSGLKKGADAYLVKPFDKEELIVRLNKLLELRARLQQKYASLEEPVMRVSLEDEFMNNVRDTIETNIEDEFFGIEELCRAIGMSRAQLHRKLKALTGLSTSHYIRSIRLHKAKAVLKQTDLNISQVAYEVGFSDPKYFSRVFTQAYGRTPMAFRNEG